MISPVAFAAFGLLALASPIAKAEDNAHRPNRVFRLSNFYFSGAPHSLTQYYNFDVADGSRIAHCGTTSSVSPGLMPFGPTPCNESAWSFSFLYNDKAKPQPGYLLRVTEVLGPKCNVTATRFFAKDAVVLVENPFTPNGNFYALQAPTAFNMNTRTVHY